MYILCICIWYVFMCVQHILYIVLSIWLVTFMLCLVRCCISLFCFAIFIFITKIMPLKTYGKIIQNTLLNVISTPEKGHHGLSTNAVSCKNAAVHPDGGYRAERRWRVKVKLWLKKDSAHSSPPWCLVTNRAFRKLPMNVRPTTPMWPHWSCKVHLFFRGKCTSTTSARN